MLVYTVGKRKCPDRRGLTRHTLTLEEAGHDIFVLWNRPKTSSCQLPYQCHSSSPNCTRQLFKPLKDSASLLVCTQKNFLVAGCGFSVSEVISD